MTRTKSADKTEKQAHKGGDLRRTIRLFRQFRGSPKVYIAGVVLLVFEAATAVVEPYPIAYLIDFLQNAKPSLRELGAPVLLESERFETILLLTLGIVLIAAVNSAADSLTEVCMARGGRSLGYSIRVAMYSHLQRLPLAYHDRRRTGDVLTRVTGDVLVLEDFVVKSVSNILGSLLVLVGSFAFLAYQSWNVAVIALVVVPLLALVSNHYSKRIKVASKTQRDREGDLASTAQEMLTSIRLVQSYGRGSVDLERFSSQTARSMRASLGAANIQAQFSFVIALTEALAISAVIWLGVWLVDRDAITIGTLVLFVLLLQNMFKPARKIVSEWYKIGKVFASVERIEDLLDREVVVQDAPDAKEAPRLEGRLTFDHVGFTYPNEHADGSQGRELRPVLKDIDFEIEPGEVVALVGPSGAGKSTIAQLVPRLYDPDRGQVLVDGIPVRELTLASLRAQVTVVLQDTVLLSGTVAENIGYGIADATQEDIEAAARMANAHEFISELPDGYETQLGERGATLSGGQRQRISIARAFIRNAPILILDEPTNGLDRESAETVVNALRELMRGTTTIVISHDEGLVQCADRVLVVSDGRISDSVSYDGLHPASSAAPSRVPARRRRSVPLAQPVTLVEPLQRHLPDLSAALDGDFVRDCLKQLVVRGERRIEELSVAKVWLREDGSCTLRYRLRLSSEGDAESEALLLARLHPDEQSAEEYLRAEVDGLLPSTENGAAPPPWRSSSIAVPDTGLALHRFPLDPQLPTLGEALDPGAVGRLAPFRHAATPPDVSLVHYPREGAAVLRYDLPRGAAQTGPGSALYGKVFPDRRSADAATGALRTLSSAADLLGPDVVVRFPQLVCYAPGIRLLVTEALPGEPLIARLVKEALADASDTSRAAPGPVPELEIWEATVLPARVQAHPTLRTSVVAAGRALAALHQARIHNAPRHSLAREMQTLHQEVDVVGRFWPDLAARVAECVGTLPEPAGPVVPVLSHGDFTPSQVLLGGGVPSVVDLDTLCLADPALDLGRFLAHLELLVVKVGGWSPTARALVDDLAHDFLRGYSEVSHWSPLLHGEERIRVYMATSLARTALHACRQLKSNRLDLAMSLLHSASAERIHA